MRAIIDKISNYYKAGRIPVATILITIFLGLAFYVSATQSIWLDEGLSIDFSKNNLSYIVNLAIIADLHPPLYYLMLHFSNTLIGSSIFAGRFWSVVFFSITAWLFYSYFKSKKINNNLSVLYLSLFLLSPFSFFYASETRSYSLIILVSLLQFIYFEKIITSDKPKDQFFYFLWSLVGIYLFYPFLFSLIAQFDYIALEQRNRFKKFFVVWLVLFLLYLPWMYLVILKRIGVVPGHFLSVPWWQIPAVIFVGFSGGRSAITDVNHLHWYWPTILISTANALQFTGFWWWFKNKEEYGYLKLLLYLFLIPLSICLIVSATRFSIFDPRYYTQLFFVFIIYIVFANHYIFINLKKIWYFVTTFLVVGNVLFLGLYLFNPWFEREPWKKVVPVLEQKFLPNDAVVFIGILQPPPTFTPYQTRQMKIISTYPDGIKDFSDFKTINEHLKIELSGVERVWYSQFLEWQKDPAGIIRKMIEENYRYVETIGFFKVKFDLYERK